MEPSTDSKNLIRPSPDTLIEIDEHGRVSKVPDHSSPPYESKFLPDKTQLDRIEALLKHLEEMLKTVLEFTVPNVNPLL